MRLLVALAIANLLASSGQAEDKTVKIPLKKVWAWAMPGTRQVFELDPQVVEKLPDSETGIERIVRGQKTAYDLQEESLAYQFLTTLDELAGGEKPDKGFVVPGTGTAALKNATSARLKKSPPSAVREGEVTLVFFSHKTAPGLEIENIIRRGRQIDVMYRFRRSEAMILGTNFALIPLGRLAEGEYSVDITPTRKSPATRDVCRPFVFTVEER